MIADPLVPFQIADLLVPFQYDYMVRAMLTSAMVGIVCAALSCFITLRGWSLMGDALAHSVVPGIALAFLGGVPFAIGAFASGMLAAAAMGGIRQATRIREDAVIGIVFTAFFAAGILLISIYPSNINLKTILYGNILAIATSDIRQMIAISLVTMCILAVKWRDLVVVGFDPAHARAIGINVPAMNMLLLSLLAANAVAALQAVGACLVVAMLVTPGATAYLFCDRFGRMLVLSMAIGAVTSAVGAYASYFLDGSTGGCIVVLQTLVFLVSLLLAPMHGVLASRARAQIEPPLAA
jgi:manganese/iron transport system permease protein